MHIRNDDTGGEIPARLNPFPVLGGLQGQKRLSKHVSAKQACCFLLPARIRSHLLYYLRRQLLMTHVEFLYW
jgi:hypothetical protein